MALIAFAARRPAPLPPLPNSNGHADLVKAARLVRDSSAMPQEIEREALSQFVLLTAQRFMDFPLR